MKRTIWKYDLEITDDQKITMPLGSEIFCAQSQNDVAQLWAVVNPNEPGIEIHHIKIFGTGHPIDDTQKLNYIDTIQFRNGRLVWHVFELIS